MSKPKYELLEEQALDVFSNNIHQEIKVHKSSGAIFIDQLLEIIRCTLLDMEIAFDCATTKPHYAPNTRIEKAYVVEFQIATKDYTMNMILSTPYNSTFDDLEYKLSGSTSYNTPATC